MSENRTDGFSDLKYKVFVFLLMTALDKSIVFIYAEYRRNI